MRSLVRGGFFALLGMIFSGCSHWFFNPNLDLGLSTLDSVEVLPDVSSVAFEWKRINDANIDGFVVYRQDGGGKFERIAVIENPLATHFYDGGLKPESVYGYQFALLGKNNTISHRSQVFRVKTSFIDAIEALYATSDEPRLVKLIWSPHPNPSIEKYVIEKRIDGVWKVIGEVKNRLAVEYYDRDLLDGVTYEYRVAGVSFQGDLSRYSAIAQATTKFPPPPLNHIVASDSIMRTISLKWEASTIKDLTGYVVYASQDEKGRFKKIAEVLKPSFEFKTEKDGMEWFFKVVAVDKDGIQGSLAQVPVRGISLPPPSGPIVQGASVENGEAVIGWEKPTQRVNRIVVFRKEGIFDTPLEFRLDSKARKFVDKEMKSGVEYTYWVKFFDIYEIPSPSSKEFKLKKP